MSDVTHIPGPYKWEGDEIWTDDLLGTGICIEWDRCNPFTLAKNKALVIAAITSYDKHFGPKAIEAAESDVLGQALELLRGCQRAVSDQQELEISVRIDAFLDALPEVKR